MDGIIEVLKDKNIDYDFIRINNRKTIKFKWVNESKHKIINDFRIKKVELKEEKITRYFSLYAIVGSDDMMLIEHQVRSHVQLPKLMLEEFRTNERLYYIDSATNKVINKSASTYNTELGYYSLLFEEHLSKNYEKIIKDLISEIVPFAQGKVKNIKIKKLNNKVNKLFLMALFRNPKQVEEINKISLSAKLIKNGYSPEILAMIGEEMNENFIKGYTALPIINRTKLGLVTVKSFFTNLNIDNGIECMVMLPHPKFAIALIPNKYYEEMVLKQGNQTYLLMDKELELLKMNKQIYYYAKQAGDDIIGIKDDLELLLSKIDSK